MMGGLTKSLLNRAYWTGAMRRLAGAVLLLFLALGAARPAFAAIAFDHASTATFVNSGASVTVSYTVNAGSNRVLIVGISIGGSNGDAQVSNVTYGAATLTKIGDSPANNNKAGTSLWRLIAPSVGTATVTVTLDPGADVVLGVSSFTGVDQTTPTGTFAAARANNGAPTVNVTSAINELVVDVVAVGGGPSQGISPAVIQTPLYNTNSGTGALSSNVFGGGSSKPGAALVPMSWTQLANKDWAIVAVPLRPAPPTPTIAKSFSPTTIASGGTSTLTITLTNPTAVPLTAATFTDTFPTSPGAMTVASPLTTSNTCGGALQNNSGGALASGAPGIRLTGGTIPANSFCTITVNVTAAVAGTYNNTIAAGALTTSGGSNAAAASASLTVALPSLTVAKTVLLVSDPTNGVTNPKNIPGAVVLYSIQVTNSGAGTADNNTTVIVDPIPANTTLFVGDLGAVGSGPVVFVDGSPSSGLTYTFTSLASITDDVSFSNSGCGGPFTYTPVPVAGFDVNVTCIRINPKGVFAAASGGNNPSFQARFQVRVN